MIFVNLKFTSFALHIRIHIPGIGKKTAPYVCEMSLLIKSKVWTYALNWLPIYYLENGNNGSKCNDVTQQHQHEATKWYRLGKCYSMCITLRSIELICELKLHFKSIIMNYKFYISIEGICVYSYFKILFA